MRVLVVDHDSTVLEATVRALREHFVIDAVTNKADCIDLLRQNTFDIVVACERLEDGSGLELLSQVAKRWPATLRVFAADRERLRLLQGRLGPFELFQALSYPINPEKLLSTLSLAQEAHDAHADTTTIQHIVLSGEDAAEPEPPPPPPAPVPSRTPGARPRHPSMGSRRSATVPVHSVRERPIGAPPPPAVPLISKRRATRIAPPPYPSSADAPVMSDSLAEAAEMAAAARSQFESDEPDSPGSGKAFIAGAVCAAALLAIGLFALKLSSSKSTIAPAATARPARPELSKAVTDQVAAVEADFEQDDLKKAGADIRTLQELAPGHPRLRFFMTLLERSNKAVHDRVAAREKSEPPSVKSESPASTAASPHRAATVTTVPARPEMPAPQPPSSGNEERPVLVAGAPTSSVPLLVPASAVPDTSESASGSQLASPSQRASGSQLGADSQLASATPAASTVPGPGPASALSASSQARTAISDAPPQAPARSSAPPAVAVEAQLTHRVEAQYPDSALRKGIQGYVDVQFTITPQGTVTNVAVVRSDPGDIFDHAAVDAVSRWRYDPRVVDGRPVESQSKARVRFKLDSSLSH